MVKSTIQEGILATLQQNWRERLEAGETIPRIAHEIGSETGQKLAWILLTQNFIETEESRLKITIVETASAERQLFCEHLDFFTWLVQNLGLKSD